MKMKSFMHALMALVIGLTLFSCAKEKEKGGAEPSVSLTVTPAELVFEAVGAADQTVTVTCDTYWKAYLDDEYDWVEIDMEEGYLNQTITVSILEDNFSAEPLTAILTIVAGRHEKEVTITQSAGERYVTIKDAPEVDFKFECEADTTTFVVESNVEWTAASNAAWLTILGNESGVDEKTEGKATYEGQGDQKVVYVLAANTDAAERSGKITVTAGEISKEFTVTQKGYTDKVSVDPEELVVSASGGEFEVSVSANTDWELIDGPCPWCTPDTYSGTKEGATIKFTIESNTLPDMRQAEYFVKVDGSGVYAKITIKQRSATQDLVVKDSLALVAIYNAADGANWKEDKVWDLTKPMDEWYGVTLNAERRVSALKVIAANTISSEWELPAAIGELTELTDLRFNSQKLTGTLPEEVYSLTKLTDLYFQNNALGGSISSNIYKLTELKNFYIDRNADLGGELPASIGFLNKLANINISQTSIGGVVPSTMANCSALINFMAFKTQFTSIGDNWDKYASIKIIQFHSTPTLDGPLPASIGRSATVTSIQLYGCNFTGNVPESWANLSTACTFLQVHQNKLSGVLPVAFVQHTNYVNNKWKPATNILPQQEGYGLTEPVPND